MQISAKKKKFKQENQVEFHTQKNKIYYTTPKNILNNYDI